MYDLIYYITLVTYIWFHVKIEYDTLRLCFKSGGVVVLQRIASFSPDVNSSHRMCSMWYVHLVSSPFWETDLRVRLGEFMVKSAKLGRKICI